MKVTDIYQITNDIYGEVVEGDSPLLQEDLSNIVDIGKAIFDATSVDNFVRKLVDHIGRVVFVIRKYEGSTPSLLMDSWEFGSVKQKITMKTLPVAETNSTWDLQNGQTYNQDEFTAPDVACKFFDKYVSFEVTLSLADKQVKSAFDNAEQVNSLYSMIYTAMDTALTARLDALMERTINNLMAATIDSEFPDPLNTTPYNGGTGVRAVNLLYMYNQQFGTSLAKADALVTPEFIRYANMVMNMYRDRLTKLSTLFNIEGYERFTPRSRQHFVLLSNYINAAKSYLYSDTYNMGETTLDMEGVEVVPYWQGTGATYDLAYTSEINVEFDDGAGSTKTVDLAGVLGVLFDHEAAGVSCLRKNITMHRNDRAEFQNVWSKAFVGYFNDFAENCVVFFIA